MRTAKPLKDKLSEKSQPLPNGCVLWTGKVNRYGYGLIFHNKKCITAHRVSFILNNGSDVAGKLICHSCDNPTCVNPEHLFLGTHKDNTQDMIRKGRHGMSNLQKSSITPEKFREIVSIMGWDLKECSERLFKSQKQIRRYMGPELMRLDTEMLLLCYFEKFLETGTRPIMPQTAKLMEIYANKGRV